MIKIRNRYAIDQRDELLIRLLTKKGRASLTELGKFLGMSSQSVGKRMKAMEQAGIIEGYTVNVNWELIVDDIDIIQEVKEWAEDE